MTVALLWLLAIALIAIGLVGTVMPALPGTLLVFAGIVLGAWIGDFTQVSTGTLIVIGVLTVLSWALDYAAGLMGAGKVGASRQAIIGAAIGTVVGIFGGFIGVLFFPLIGAAIGEYLARKDQRRAMHVGIATWLGILVGLVAKVVLAFVMIGIFVVALIV